MTSVLATRRRSWRSRLAAYPFVVPATLTLLALVLYPFLYGIYVGFFKTNLVNRWEFVGLQNYMTVLGGVEFWRSLGTTVLFTAGVVAGHFVIGFVLADLLNKEFRGRTFFRVVLLLPWLLPVVVVANIYKWILNPTNGILSAWLRDLGIIDKPMGWLGNPTFALPVVILICIWKGYALVMLQILAGLQTLSREVQEAAEIDGANAWQSFWHVTLPGLKPTLIVVLVLDTLWWFKHVTIIWLLTQGGPGTSTTTIAVDIYKRAFEYFDFGSASALAVIVFLICLGINFAYQRGLNNEED